jgi:hypothetical protein
LSVFPVTVDPQDFQGQYGVTGGPTGLFIGQKTLDLEGGRAYTLNLNGIGNFPFAVDTIACGIAARRSQADTAACG